MAVITTYDGFISRLLNGFGGTELIDQENNSATTSTLLGGSAAFISQRTGITRPMPSLPTGVSAFIPLSINLSNSVQTKTMIFGRGTKLGTFDNSSNTFTDGSAMPSRTVFNTASTKIASAVIAYVTTAFNSTPGNLSITYKDQNDNAAQSTTAVAITASAAVGTAQLVTLSSPDWGVVDVTGATRTGGTATFAGVMEFWGVEPLGIIDVSPFSTSHDVHQSFLTAGNFVFQRWAANDQLICWSMSSTAANRTIGDITFVGDST